jgi:single-strand DNA-binding protein
MNNITISGSLGRDAETKYLNNGDAVASFSVADSQGKDKPTIWWNCSLFGKRAGSLIQYLTKGQAVTVVGSVSQREYTDKEGQKKTAIDVRVNDIALQGGKRESSEQPVSRPAPTRSAPPALTAPPKGTQGSGFDDMSDDCPF